MFPKVSTFKVVFLFSANEKIKSTALNRRFKFVSVNEIQKVFILTFKTYLTNYQNFANFPFKIYPITPHKRPADHACFNSSIHLSRFLVYPEYFLHVNTTRNFRVKVCFSSQSLVVEAVEVQLYLLFLALYCYYGLSLCCYWVFKWSIQTEEVEGGAM